MSSWTKAQWDQYYHLLRVLSNEGTSDEQRAARGLYDHLVIYQKGAYPGLLTYLEYYGCKFLVPKVVYHVRRRGWKFNRIVDLGAGTGWLGRELTKKFRLSRQPMSVDKRYWDGVTHVLDLEQPKDVKDLCSCLEPKDLLVCCELVHCLANPELLLKATVNWPLVILEYDSADPRYGQSYLEQVRRYGASPWSPSALQSLLADRTGAIRKLHPYYLMMINRAGP